MLLKREREARLTRRSSYSWPLPSSATVMPQNEAYENQNLWMNTATEPSHSCYRGSSRSDLVHGGKGLRRGMGGLRRERASMLWLNLLWSCPTTSHISFRVRCCFPG